MAEMTMFNFFLLSVIGGLVIYIGMLKTRQQLLLARENRIYHRAAKNIREDYERLKCRCMKPTVTTAEWPFKSRKNNTQYDQ